MRQGRKITGLNEIGGLPIRVVRFLFLYYSLLRRIVSMKRINSFMVLMILVGLMSFVISFAYADVRYKITDLGISA